MINMLVHVSRHSYLMSQVGPIGTVLSYMNKEIDRLQRLGHYVPQSLIDGVAQLSPEPVMMVASSVEGLCGLSPVPFQFVQ